MPPSAVGVDQHRLGDRRLSLALQGGGSLGAFAWGVLDRLLEEEDLTFDALSGASAGAVNAVIVAAGLLAGGKAEARRRLDHFWERSSQMAPPDPGATATFLVDMASRLMSPYQLNPFNLNPLEGLLSAEVDFEALRAASPVRLLIAATAVSNGRLRIFRETELTPQMVLASACLPLLSQAVEIGGERYWDGGFSANPPLISLVEASDASDVLIVQIMPTAGAGAASLLARHRETPRTDPLQRGVFEGSCRADHDGAGGWVREPGPSVVPEAAAAAPPPSLGRTGVSGAERSECGQS